jgi:carboxyl-terminal processing protease
LASMKKHLPAVLMGVLNALLVALAFASGWVARDLLAARPLPNPLAPAPEYPLLTEARQLLAARFIRALPDDKTLEYAAVHGMVSAVRDPYTVFVEPQNHELQTQTLQGEFGGIGVSLQQRKTDQAFVLTPILDSPAAKAGIVDGDVLLAVDGQPLTPALTMDAVTALVRGPIGTPVTITAQHVDGQSLSVTIIRQRIEIPSATWKLAETAPSVGIITLSRFSEKSPAEVERALNELQAQGAARFVLDLRNNGGGLLESGVKVATLFLDGGVVMYETQRDAPEKVYSAPNNQSFAATAPLVVIVNGNTASAAEIVAGALLDRNRAPLIGQKTFGKGSVQLVYDLSDKSSLHVTAYLWYTPARRELDGQGLVPTYEVAPGTDGRDPEMEHALNLLIEALSD